MNSVNIIGRLVRDPEQVETQSGTTITKFSIAVDDGKDETSFYDCKSFAKTAELVMQYKHKGDQVGVSGRLKQERWEKDGAKRSAVRIIAERVTFIGPKQDTNPAAEMAKKAADVFGAAPDEYEDGIPW